MSPSPESLKKIKLETIHFGAYLSKQFLSALINIVLVKTDYLYSGTVSFTATGGHRRSQHEARGGNCLLLNFQIDNDFASCFASSNKIMIQISTNYH